MPESLVIQAFYLSKQTVTDEIDMANYEYTYLHWPEFIEFIGRIAQLKHRNMNHEKSWTLQKKISVVLRFLLKLVGKKAKNAP